MEQVHGIDTAGADAARGTRIHKALETGDWTALNMEETDTAEMCQTQMHRIYCEWLGSHEESAEHLYREKRLGLTVIGAVREVTPDSPATFIFTGMADVIAVDGKRALVIDYKTGRAEVPLAKDNAQLVSLAVLVHRFYGVEEVQVAIVQPWAGKPTVADFGGNALTLAHGWLMESLERAKNSTEDDINPGDHCTYCKAAHVCPKTRKMALQEVERIDPASIAGLPAKEQASAMWARALALTPAQHIAAYRGLEIIGRYAAKVKSTFRQRVEAGEIPGFTIETKLGNREITDAQKAFTALEALGVTVEDVLEACSIPIGKMEEAARKRSGIKSQTDKRTVYNLTADAAKKAVTHALESAGAMGRKADKSEIVEITALD